jgi:hypothetical protein
MQPVLHLMGAVMPAMTSAQPKAETLLDLITIGDVERLGDPTISTLSVSAAGCVIASASGVEPSTGAFTMTGVTQDHEQLAAGTFGANMRECAGHATGLSATSTYNVQATSTAGFEALVAVSFV